MTMGKYLTNASFKNINLNKAQEKLYKEWEKKNISYPRSDGKNHSFIKILKPNKINNEVKSLLEMDLEIDFKIKYNKVSKHTIYYIAEQLNLSTPSSLIADIHRTKYKKFKLSKIKKDFKKFKIDKKLDNYLKIKDCSLKNIIKIKNKKLKKDKFNQIFKNIQEKNV